MAANLKKLLVVDIEATCWRSLEEQGDKPNEVIEIGICTIDLSTGIIGNGSSFVIKPRFTTVSKFCTELTGWTQQDVDAGIDIAAALQQLQEKYNLSKYHIWFSCGEYDRIKLGSHGHASLGGLYGIAAEANPFATMRHENIKMLFALKHKLKREMGMARMLTHIGETLDGKHHNGLDDALNTAKLVKNVFS